MSVVGGADGVALATSPDSSASKKSRLEFRTTIEAANEKTTEDKPIEWSLDLGKQLCNAQLEIEWTIVNDSDHTWQCPQIKPSCSCLSEVPKTVSIEAGTSKTLEFKIHLPRVTEPLNRQIIFSDDHGNALAQANIVGEVLLPIRPLSDRLDVAKDGPQKIVIPIERTFEDIVLEELQIGAYGVGVTGAVLGIDEAKRPAVIVSMNTTGAKQQSTTVPISIEVSQSGSPMGTTPITLRMLSRTIYIQSPLSLQRVGSEYVGTFRISSIGLANAAIDEKPFIAIAKFGDRGKELKLRVEIEKPTPPASTSSITVRCDVKEIGGRVPTSVQLSCGDWRGAIDCKFTR